MPDTVYNISTHKIMRPSYIYTQRKIPYTLTPKKGVRPTRIFDLKLSLYGRQSAFQYHYMVQRGKWGVAKGWFLMKGI